MQSILSVLALALSAPLALAAQEAPAPHSYPAEFVLGLLSAKADQLTVGKVPEEMAERLPLPAEARVLGAVRRGQGSSKVIVDVDGTASKIAADYGSLLESRDWKRHQQYEQKGLLTAGPEQEQMYCAEDGWFVTFRAGPSSDGAVRLAIHLMAGGDYSPCNRQSGRNYQDRMDEAPFPALLPPDGARTHGSGSSRGPDFSEQTISLMSDLTLGDVLEHYATQLREHGWTESEYCLKSSFALQTWKVYEVDGPTWEGALTISRAGGVDAERKSVSLRLSQQD